MYLFYSLLFSACLAFIPANIAKKKGHSFGLWWFYGWMLFLVAVIHVNFIEDKNAPQFPINPTIYNPNNTPNHLSANPTKNVADELKKFKELYDMGAITEEEFKAKK